MYDADDAQGKEQACKVPADGAAGDLVVIGITVTHGEYLPFM